MSLLKIEIVDRHEDFERLDMPWRALCARVPSARFTQSYDWCHAGWQHHPASGNSVLQCLVVWQQDQLVALWPLMRVQCDAITELQVIGAGLGEEYADPLIDPAIDNEQTCLLMLRALHDSADLLKFHFLTRDSTMAGVLRRNSRFFHHFECNAFMIDATGTTDIESHLKRYSSHFRKEVHRKMKTLSALGAVRFEMAQDDREVNEIIQWLMQHKHNWMLKRGIPRDWFVLTSSLAFMRAVSKASSADGQLGLFGLRLDGRLIAASASIIDRVGVEGMFITYDMEYSHYSPGLVTVIEQLRWAQQRGKVLDMRILEVDFKKRIATSSRIHQSFVIGCTVTGVLKIAPKVIWDKLRYAVRKVFPASFYEWLKCKAKVLRKNGSHLLLLMLQFPDCGSFMVG